MKNFLLFFIVVMAQQIRSQEVYFNAGKNYTSYNYKNSDGNSISFFDSKNASRFQEGSSYEAGYVFNAKKHKVYYTLGLTLNQFNAKYFLSGTSDASVWKTKYVGFQNLVSYAFFSSQNGLELAVKGGFNVSHIVNGEQYSNGIYYDISNQVDFKGIMVQSMVGLQVKYKIASTCFLSLGYNLSTVTNLSDSSKESLGFTNNQVQFGVYLPFKLPLKIK